MSYNLDCRYFSGYKPCRFKRACVGCPEYDPVQTRIAIVSLEALGAVLRSTCLLLPLRRKYPNAHITWITYANAAPLLENNPEIDRIIPVDAKFNAAIHFLQFDILCAVDKSLEAGAIAESIKAREKYGFGIDTAGMIRPLSEHAYYQYDVGLDDHLKFFVNQKTETQQITESMALEWKRDPYILALSTEEKKEVEQTSARFRVHTPHVIGYNTGCSVLYSYKKFTVERAIETIRMWRTSFPDFSVALLGGREDFERQRKIKEAFSDDVCVINTPADGGLRQGVLQMAATDLVFTGCSLGLHIAVGLSKPVLAWFGVSCPQEIDLYDRGEKLIADVSCTPCWKKRCNNEPKCYDQVSPERIKIATSRVIKSFLSVALFFLCSSSIFAADKTIKRQDPMKALLIHTHTSETESVPFVKKNFGNEVIYQIVVDRFFNANDNHRRLYNGVYAAQGGPSAPFLHHGGDLRGIIKNLPYLKRLGATRLWLTPIFENQHVAVKRRSLFAGDIEVSSYHGYWMKDWFRLDPFYTDKGPDDFEIVQELVDQAAPIRIYLDTVFNHSSPRDASSESITLMNQHHPISEIQDENAQRGVVFRRGKFFASYPFDTDDPKFFNHNPSISGSDWQDPWRVENYSLENLADFNQQNSRFQKYMDEAHDFWLRRFPGLAGYRIDTIKHVPMWYWQQFSERFYNKFPSVEIFGEYYGGGSHNESSIEFFRQTPMSMFDFRFHDVMLDIFLKNASFSALSDLWRDDHLLGDARSMITFLDSHDLPRMRGLGVSIRKMRQAIALLMVSRGIPCIYYGMEQDLFHPNDPGDPYNRPMMKSFDTESESFRFVRRLVSFRKKHDALRWGKTRLLHLTEHIIAFERTLEDDKVFFVTSKNRREGSDDFEITQLSLPDGSYKDILSGQNYEVRGGSIPVRLKTGDIVILASEDS